MRRGPDLDGAEQRAGRLPPWGSGSVEAHGKTNLKKGLQEWKAKENEQNSVTERYDPDISAVVLLKPSTVMLWNKSKAG